jgi:hypothetical protein
MQIQTAIDKNTEKAKTLLRQGYIAYNNWENNKARLLWRKAAICDPANEEIWLALLQVLQTDEDRKVCMQNILVLNPDNAEAEQRLRLIESETQPAEAQTIEPQLEPSPPIISNKIKRAVSWILTGLLLFTIGIVLFAMLIQPFF